MYESIFVFSLLCTLHTINTYAARPSAEASEALRSAAEEERPQGATTRSTIHLVYTVIKKCVANKKMDLGHLRSSQRAASNKMDLGHLRSSQRAAGKNMHHSPQNKYAFVICAARSLKK